MMATHPSFKSQFLLNRKRGGGGGKFKQSALTVDNSVTFPPPEGW
jgi:hypothetical protein